MCSGSIRSVCLNCSKLTDDVNFILDSRVRSNSRHRCRLRIILFICDRTLSARLISSHQVPSRLLGPVNKIQTDPATMLIDKTLYQQVFKSYCLARWRSRRWRLAKIPDDHQDTQTDKKKELPERYESEAHFIAFVY